MTADTPALGSTVRIDNIVLDCPDPALLAAFYAGILGWQVTDSDDDWTGIRDPQAPNATGMAFQLARDFRAPTWPDNSVPQQSHLDLVVPDLDAAEQRVLAAGATVTGMPNDGATSFRVYLDPAGHPFCLCVG